MLRVIPAITLLVFLGPLAAGLLGTFLPAIGYLPVLGGERASLAPLRDLLAAPGLATALRTTLVTGLASTLIALGLTVLAFAAGHGTRAFAAVRRAMAPLLAVPHAAVAVGLAFVMAPSGWLVRLATPWPSGLATPPDLATVQDPLGMALILGLVVKETPFLALMAFAALGQLRTEEQLRVARSLGYGPVRAWLAVVLPQVYPQIRLPVYAVLAYGLSVVDMALVLGPTAPPPLAPMVLRWFQDPNLDLRFQAAAGATLQLAVVVGAIALWRGGEALVVRLARPLLARGRRGGSGALPRRAAALGLGLLLGLSLASLLSLALWSLAAGWRFPDAFPERLTLAGWARQLGGLAGPAWTTLTVGLAAAMFALALVVGCLENEERMPHRPGRAALYLIYLPLLVPQIAFLFGFQMLLVRLDADGTWAALVLAHLLFVVPYVFLVLADPYRALDPRYARIARALGKRPWTVFLRVKLPMLLRPVCLALAIGFAVSVAQYLPTLFAGAGRHATLTTEALALAAGGDRRLIGVTGFTLAALPLLAFALALALPAWRFRDRRALRGAG